METIQEEPALKCGKLDAGFLNSEQETAKTADEGAIKLDARSASTEQKLQKVLEQKNPEAIQLHIGKVEEGTVD